MRGFVKSSPYFFRLIGRAAAAIVAGLLVCAVLFPAPLQEPASRGIVPNPVKSAWFLLWLQELVSYGAGFIYLVIGGALLFLLLPWLPISLPAHRAVWFPRDQRVVTGATVAVVIAIVGLTLVAAFFRGENWSLVFPF